jgi:hypothetical protein
MENVVIAVDEELSKAEGIRANVVQAVMDIIIIKLAAANPPILFEALPTVREESTLA